MVPVKTLVIGGAMISAMIGLIPITIHSAIAKRLQSKTCKTWEDVKSEVQMIYMGAIDNSAIPNNMPQGFQNGCVYGDFGAYTISFYILKDGLKTTNIKPENERFLDSSIPRINAANPNIERQIKSGNILHVFNVCSSTRSISFCKGTPKDKAYAKDGLVCLRNICIEAKNLPEKDLMKLWNN